MKLQCNSSLTIENLQVTYKHVGNLIFLESDILIIWLS